jgi:hypothetical protein
MGKNPGPNFIHALLCSYVLFKTNGKSFLRNWSIGMERIQILSFFTGKMVYNDIRQAEKNQIILKAQAVYYSLVSQQQKLCKAEQPKGQTPADASFNGPQGRMAPLKSLIIRQQ